MSTYYDDTHTPMAAELVMQNSPPQQQTVLGYTIEYYSNTVVKQFSTSPNDNSDVITILRVEKQSVGLVWKRGPQLRLWFCSTRKDSPNETNGTLYSVNSLEDAFVIVVTNIKQARISKS